jgi:hypothetical protein
MQYKLTQVKNFSLFLPLFAIFLCWLAYKLLIFLFTFPSADEKAIFFWQLWYLKNKEKKIVFPNTPAVALQLRSGQNTSRGKRQWKAFPYKWLDHTFYSSGEILIKNMFVLNGSEQ